MVANARAAASKLVEEGVPSQKIELIGNGIDVSRYAVATAMDGRTVTTVAHLRPGKGIDVLLRAAALLLARMP